MKKFILALLAVAFAAAPSQAQVDVRVGVGGVLNRPSYVPNYGAFGAHVYGSYAAPFIGGGSCFGSSVQYFQPATVSYYQPPPTVSYYQPPPTVSYQQPAPRVVQNVVQPPAKLVTPAPRIVQDPPYLEQQPAVVTHSLVQDAPVPVYQQSAPVPVYTQSAPVPLYAPSYVAYGATYYGGLGIGIGGGAFRERHVYRSGPILPFFRR
jgi:hypothetical protein